ncbi:soluble lytic murein transglycosylase [bacterium MnTg02]|nr:soluble lytic murein transglycosylase [bacterium MnTg02]
MSLKTVFGAILLVVVGSSMGFLARGEWAGEPSLTSSAQDKINAEPRTLVKLSPPRKEEQKPKIPKSESPPKPEKIAAPKPEPTKPSQAKPVPQKLADESIVTGATGAPAPSNSTAEADSTSNNQKPAPARNKSNADAKSPDQPSVEVKEIPKTAAQEPSADTKARDASKSDTDKKDEPKTAAQDPSAATNARDTSKSSTEKKDEPKVAAQDPGSPDLEKILKPVLTYKISKADLKQVSRALTLINRKKASQAKAAMKNIKDIAARDLVRWYGLVKELFVVTPEQSETIRKENPDWTELYRLRKFAERNLLLSNPPAARLRKFYADEPPQTDAGIAGQAIIHLDAGEKVKAKELAIEVWRHRRLSKRLESIVHKRLGSLLTADDHRFRAHRMLFSRKKGAAARAQRVAKYLTKSERRIVSARASALRRSSKKLTALPAKAKKDPTVLFSRIRLLRRKKSYSKAWVLLKSQPKDKESLIEPDAWWLERRRLLREALERGKAKIAYRIAKNHGPITVNHLNEAEFLAGWISLRFLKDAKTAKTHFAALSKSADGPRSRSRGHYWLGRAAKALGETAEANKHFTNGAKDFNTFYGQLSGRAANPNSTTLVIAAPPAPTPEEIKRFLNRQSVKAVVIAHKAGAKAVANRILGGFRKLLNSSGEFVLAAELGKQIGQTQQSLRIGKTAMFYGHALARYAYPTHAMPKFKALRKLPEQSIFYAVTRQESEFNPRIVSHAGARGLMQVMPITAKHVARQHKVKYQLKRLLSDPVYNVKIATAYIADRMDEFKGSYVKSLAGFNAGPGRVRQWVKKFGDPSSPSIDPIDWIEQIPFNETRNYVKKVMANVQVYRARLGDPENALQIDIDLLRGRKAGIPAIQRASN